MRYKYNFAEKTVTTSGACISSGYDEEIGLGSFTSPVTPKLISEESLKNRGLWSSSTLSDMVREYRNDNASQRILVLSHKGELWELVPEYTGHTTDAAYMASRVTPPGPEL